MKQVSLLKAAAAIVVALTSVPILAQTSPIDSLPGSDVQLNATISESLTVSLNVAAVNFTLTPGSATNPGSTPISATTTWLLASGRTAVTLYAYFDTPTAALTAGALQNIPSSAVSAAVGGTSVGTFSSAIAASTFSGTGVTIFSQPITSANLGGSQVSTVTLNINLTGVSNLGAGTYTGTLHFRAEAAI
jgi:hypothetical protein